MAARVLKIGMHLRFDPKFTVEFEHFDQKHFRQAYCSPTTLDWKHCGRFGIISHSVCTMQQVVSMISSIPVTANSVVWWHVNGLCSTTLIPHDKMFALLWLNDDLFEIRFVVLYCFLYFCLYLGWCVAVSVPNQPCHPQVGKHHIGNSHL